LAHSKSPKRKSDSPRKKNPLSGAHVRKTDIDKKTPIDYNVFNRPTKKTGNQSLNDYIKPVTRKDDFV